MLFTPKQIEQISQPTPKEALEAYKTADGTELTGVKWTYFLPLLNNIIGVGKWSIKPYFELARIEKINNVLCAWIPIKCVINEIITSENGQVYIMELWSMDYVGSASFDKDSFPGDLLKAAITDGAKKCFSTLGICWDVYSGANSKDKKKKTRKNVHIADEDREQANKLAAEISTSVRLAVEKLKDVDSPTKEQKKIKKYQEKDIFVLATEALHKALLEEDENVDLDMNEQIGHWSDFKSIHELEVTKKYIEDYLELHMKGL